MALKFEKFDNLTVMMRELESRKNNPHMVAANSSHRIGGNFTGTETWEEAESLLLNGWEEPLEQLKRGVGQNIKTNVTRSKAIPSTGIVGYAPCVPNAIIGLPNSMITTQRTPSKVKAVSLTYSVGVNCGWSTEEMTEAGIAALNVVNDLELQGYRVALNVEILSVQKSGERLCACVKVKDWRQPMDLKKIAFTVANPSMLRRFGFRWLETTPLMTKDGFEWGYGEPLSNNEYETHLSIVRDSGYISKNEFFITAAMCRAEDYDTGRIMDRAGMTFMKQRKGA